MFLSSRFKVSKQRYRFFKYCSVVLPLPAESEIILYNRHLTFACIQTCATAPPSIIPDVRVKHSRKKLEVAFIVV